MSSRKDEPLPGAGVTIGRLSCNNRLRPYLRRHWGGSHSRIAAIGSDFALEICLLTLHNPASFLYN